VLLPDDFGECLRTILAGENSVTHAWTLSPPSRVIQHDLKMPRLRKVNILLNKKPCSKERPPKTPRVPASSPLQRTSALAILACASFFQTIPASAQKTEILNLSYEKNPSYPEAQNPQLPLEVYDQEFAEILGKQPQLVHLDKGFGFTEGLVFLSVKNSDEGYLIFSDQINETTSISSAGTVSRLLTPSRQPPGASRSFFGIPRVLRMVKQPISTQTCSRLRRLVAEFLSRSMTARWKRSLVPTMASR
jgi:hypothetical protein